MRVAERLAPWVLLAVSGTIRLVALEIRPLHHDEGSNAIFVMRLVEGGGYIYDPSNYHGPLLFYLSALSVTLFGATTWALRLVPALLGTMMAPLMWGLKDEIGRRGAFVAGLLLAVSPSMVYYSRDAIHEIYLAALTLLLVVAMARGLRSGGLFWFAVMGAAAGGMVGTKETAALVFAALLIGLAVSRGAGLPRPNGRHLVAAAGLFTLVVVLLYTHFLTDAGRLSGLVRALEPWGRRAVEPTGHEKPWWYFPGILAFEEWAVCAAALLALIICLRGGSRFARFALGWGAALLVVHSLVPYKTPWLVLNIVLPLAIAGGEGVGRLLAYTSRFGEVSWLAAVSRPATASRRFVSRVVPVTLAIVFIMTGLRAFEVSFLRYDDPGISLVYVQTRREALGLVGRIEEFADRSGRGRHTVVDIVSPDYLPLNWYLRDFERVSYYGTPIETPNGDVIIAGLDDAGEVARRLEGGYSREEFELRPGVRLVLFIREERSDL